MKCIIVDHESTVRENLKKFISDLSNLKLVGEFSDVASASAFLQKKGNVDLMFLEIDLPKKASLNFLKDSNNVPMTIATASDAKYAIEAYDYNAIDYLLKPLKFDRFIRAVAKAEERMRATVNATPHSLNNVNDFIFIKSERKYIKIDFKDLMLIEGLKDYVIVHATHGKYMTAMNVKTIHNKLPENIFFRVSKSYIINLNFIDDIDGGYVDIKEYKVPIGRSYRDVFMDFVHKRLLRR
jgi:DNA-binding LytR/AlgR family response regulator